MVSHKHPLYQFHDLSHRVNDLWNWTKASDVEGSEITKNTAGIKFRTSHTSRFYSFNTALSQNHVHSYTPGRKLNFRLCSRKCYVLSKTWDFNSFPRKTAKLKYATLLLIDIYKHILLLLLPWTAHFILPQWLPSVKKWGSQSSLLQKLFFFQD